MIDVNVDNLEKTSSEFGDLDDRIEEAVEEAGLKIAKQIFERSQEFVPEDTGRLKRSGEIKKEGNKFIVKYTADYAIYVHERVELHHDDGRAKFLEDAVKVEIDDADSLLQRVVEEAIADSF
jgi:hypothetical protein